MASGEYNKAVSAIERQTKAEIVLEIIDVNAKADATISVTSLVSQKWLLQLLSEKYQMERKVATVERDFWKLDGSFSLSQEVEDTSFHYGWWSSVKSDENRIFTTAQTLTVNFNNYHSSMGLSVYFDTATGECASDFRIQIYKDSTTLLDRSVTDNTNAIYIVDEPITDYNRIVITFTKMMNPYRRLKVSGIAMGIVQAFGNEDLIKVNSIEEIDVLNTTTPASEVTFSIDNLDKLFNILNPAGIYQYLQERQYIRAKLGVVLDDSTVEYINTGIYYLSEWKTEGLTATFTGRDILDFTADVKLSKSASQSLAQWAKDAFNAANIVYYKIDESLDEIEVDTIITDMPVKDILRNIAIASNCVLYVDRSNIVHISKLNRTDVTGGITLDDMYQVPEIELDRVINKITVSVFDKDDEEYYQYNYNDPQRKPLDPDFVYEITENPFITGYDIAYETAKYLLSLLKERIVYNITWRQNPDRQINEMVKVEDGFGENKNMLITKQEFNYSGALRGTTKGRGGQ